MDYHTIVCENILTRVGNIQVYLCDNMLSLNAYKTI